MTRRDKLNIALFIIFGALSYVNFIGPFLITILRGHILSPLLLSMVLVSKKVIKITSDAPMGMFADIFGAKKLFIYSRIVPIVSNLALLSNNTAILIGGVLLHGVALSITSGKIEAGMYKVLMRNNAVVLYPRIVAVFCFFSLILSASASYAGAILYEHGGYKMLTYATSIVAVLAIVPLFFIDDREIHAGTNRRKNLTINEIFIQLSSFLKDRKNLSPLIALWVFCSFFGMQFMYIAHMIFADIGLLPSAIARLRSLEQVLMAIGCVLSFFYSSKLSLFQAALSWFSCTLLLILSSLIYCKLLVIPIMIYSFMHPLIEIAIIRYLEGVLLPSIRSTLTSVATLSSTVFNIIGTLFIGLFAEFFGSYRYGFIIFCLLIVVVGLLTIIKIKTQSK